MINKVYYKISNGKEWEAFEKNDIFLSSYKIPRVGSSQK